ncbi:hypothetical protein [Pseudomonas syringae]|nr:hypothetical protein [Pseudomonas syringae]
MTDFDFYPLYITLSIALYLPSLWCKLKRSGKRYSKLVWRTVFTHNLVMMLVHWTVVKTNHLVFYGYIDEPLLRLMSMLCTALHATTYPVSEDERFWRKRYRLKFWKKGFDPRIR